MSQLHVRPIRVSLERLYKDKIDMSDYTKGKAEDKENKFLTRSLAAYSLQYYADIDDTIASKCVVDNYDDNGIDAIYYDKAGKKLYIVQSKWINDGNGCPSSGDTKKFADGTRDLVNCRWERFNKKINEKKNDINIALDDVNTRIVSI